MSSHRPRLSLRRTSLVVAAIAAAGSVAAIAAPSSAATGPLLGLPSVIPAWAATAQVLGVTSPTESVHVLLSLRSQDQAGLDQFVAAVSTPGDPSYHHFLTNDEFTSRFAAPASAGTAVLGWLRAAGVTDTSIDADHTAVTAVLPAALASAVFGVTFHDVSHDGVATRVPLTQPVLPAAIASLVSAVSGLTQSFVRHDDTTPLPPGYVPSTTCSKGYGDSPATGQPTYAGSTRSYVLCGYTPQQLETAYGAAAVPQKGDGVTVGIVDAFNDTYAASDTNTWSAHFTPALPSVTARNVTPSGYVDPASADPDDVAGWAGEETLDWEAVHAMAPDATILYSGAASENPSDLEAAVQRAIESGAAEVTNSYGSVDDGDSSQAQAFEQSVADLAASVGTTLFYSTGDNADEVVDSYGERQVQFPADSVSVTAVGGTALLADDSGKYLGETYWGNYEARYVSSSKSWDAPTISPAPDPSDPYGYQTGGGAGGGVSPTYLEPGWQKSVVPATLTTNADAFVDQPGRVLPDVAMDADSNTGMLVGETESASTASGSAFDYSPVGGTSLASPLFAGVIALVVQADGLQGNINPTVYGFASGAFNDPSYGRSAARTASRASDLMTGENDNTDPSSYAGQGGGVIPTFAQVLAIPSESNPSGTPTSYYLETGGNLGTLHDLPGYDDSTGLGSPNVPAFIQAFQSATAARQAAAAAAAAQAAAQAAAAAAQAAAAAAAAAHPAPACVIHGSAIKVSGPSFIAKHKQTKKYTFKLFVNAGTCAVGNSVGRKFTVYVDGHSVGTLRTGQHGTISHLFIVKGGRHVITARFPGNPDLAKSQSNSFVVHAN